MRGYNERETQKFQGALESVQSFSKAVTVLFTVTPVRVMDTCFSFTAERMATARMVMSAKSSLWTTKGRFGGHRVMKCNNRWKSPIHSV